MDYRTATVIDMSNKATLKRVDLFPTFIERVPVAVDDDNEKNVGCVSLCFLPTLLVRFMQAPLCPYPEIPREDDSGGAEQDLPQDGLFNETFGCVLVGCM